MDDFVTLAVLPAISLATSFLTATVGVGGGTVMLAVLAQVLPGAAVIPVHGVVQLGSNVGRATLMWREVNRQYFVGFALGAALGAAIGGRFAVALPTSVLQIVIAVFILYTAWLPVPAGRDGGLRILFVGGLITTVLTMFVGATGPFIMALLLPYALPPQSHIGTAAACMVIQHGLKVIAFVWLGFNFVPYVLPLMLMIAAGFAGTWLGRRVLVNADRARFERWVKIGLTVMALRLLWTGIHHLGAGCADSASALCAVLP